MIEDLVIPNGGHRTEQILWLNGLVSGVCSLGNCSQLVNFVCIYGIFRFGQSFTRMSEEARVCLDQYSTKISIRFLMALVDLCNKFCSYLAQVVALRRAPRLQAQAELARSW